MRVQLICWHQTLETTVKTRKMSNYKTLNSKTPARNSLISVIWKQRVYGCLSLFHPHTMLVQSSKLIEWLSTSAPRVFRVSDDVENRKNQLKMLTLTARDKQRLYRWSVCNKLIVCSQNRWMRRHCVLWRKILWFDSKRWSIRFPHFAAG